MLAKSACRAREIGEWEIKSRGSEVRQHGTPLCKTFARSCVRRRDQCGRRSVSMPPNALSTARHSHGRFIACLLGWDDVSLSGATTAVVASDRYVIPATITADLQRGPRRRRARLSNHFWHGRHVLAFADQASSLMGLRCRMGPPARRASLLCCAAGRASLCCPVGGASLLCVADRG